MFPFHKIKNTVKNILTITNKNLTSPCQQNRLFISHINTMTNQVIIIINEKKLFVRFLSVTSTDDILVSDHEDNHIKCYEKSGKFKFSFGEKGKILNKICK